MDIIYGIGPIPLKCPECGSELPTPEGEITVAVTCVCGAGWYVRHRGGEWELE